jgi:hypothetical protein
LRDGDDVRGAIASARELQRRWQALGPGRRRRDQAQWKQFHAAVQGVFDRADQTRAERAARDAGLREQALALCDEAEALAAAPTVERGAITRIESAWESLRVRDDALRARFRRAQDALRETERRQRKAQALARFTGWLERHALCRSAETAAAAEPADALRERWDAAPPTSIAAETLAARFGDAVAGNPREPTAAPDAFLDLLIELDLLAGTESSAAESERRRALQLAKLSARMRGGTIESPERQLEELLERWSALGPTPDPAFDARIDAAVRAVLATL